MDLVIDRTKWLRGDEGNSYLLRHKDQKMCCLGFLAIAVGHTNDEISDIESPGDINGGHFPNTLTQMGGNTPLCTELMVLNDDTELIDSIREAELITSFKKADIMVQFIN